MRLTQSGPKPCDTFKHAIYRFFCLQTTLRLSPSLPAKFQAILKCHAHGPYLRMRLIQSGPKPSVIFKFAIYRFQRLAGLPRASSIAGGRRGVLSRGSSGLFCFRSGACCGLLPFWGASCRCLVSHCRSITKVSLT